MQPRADPEFAAFVGIDWADRKHDICLQVANGEKREFDVLVHRPDAIDQWGCSSENAFRVGPCRCAWSWPRGRWSMHCRSTISWFCSPSSGNASEIPRSLHTKSCQG